ncbi:uncharacterized protein LOC128822177 [Vidua macroura]|uniref:uncharacterized protein LOC128822177 n=1 Tax=Vidua macroura TaxID=187451 RepID=UPI0023A8E88E|nr:uncharacterized protein LOC128822177 [Vidua macroura]
MAQQLRWAEEQCSKAVRLWQSAEKVKERKIMQKLARQQLEQQRLEAQKKMEQLAKALTELQCQNAALCDNMCQLRQELNKLKKGQNIKLQAELQDAQRKMKAMEKRHKEEMERMHKVLLQYSPAEEKQGVR